MKNKLLLIIAAILVFIGLFKPDINLPSFNNNNSNISCVVDAPSDDILLEKARLVVDILKQSNDSTRSNDCIQLSSLYCDMATLIQLDEEDMVIKDTASIRSANSLAGKMLRLNIKNKYPNLAEASRNLLVAAIGDEDVVLDSQSRSNAVSAFRALSWAFYEGSK